MSECDKRRETLWPSANQFSKLIEAERVAWIIREVKVSVLGNWDGCCCSCFSVRNVEVDIACGKGRDQGVWVHSHSMDYPGEKSLMPIALEVLSQVREDSGRMPDGFHLKVGHGKPWNDQGVWRLDE